MATFRPLPCFLALASALATATATAAEIGGPPRPAHGIAMHGDLKYSPGFKHFDYVNPDAPKGGTVRLYALRTFDTLNPFTLKGVTGAFARAPFDTLMTESADEPFSQYGLIAESIEVPDHRGWVIFNLRPEARFHDGTPVTADDVVFSFDILRTKGHPRFRLYYAAVEKAEALGRHKVRFTFAGGINRELPLIIGQLPVLPRHYWEERDFEKTTLTPPLGSGPYRVANVDPGRSITYERVEDYWGRDLPVNVGRHNFDVIRYDYYRDSTVALEALKAGNYDLREEHVSKFWATGYDSPPVERGLVKKLFLPHGQSTGMQAFVFNTRKEVFSDPRVRAALAYAFDFEWTNRVLFFGAYTRTKSYFSNSELAAREPPGPRELDILEPFRGRIPDEVFTEVYEPPSTGGTHEGLRRNLLTALGMLREAGWEVREGRLVDARTGRQMSFEVLLVNPSFERIVLPFIGNLKRLGIDARVRSVDASQYINRRKSYDFDMIVHVWGQSLSPGNEQHDYWSSSSAAIDGSFNLAGVRDPVVDELVQKLIAAPDRETLVAATRALDRVLLWGHYVIPHWHIRGDRLAFWDKFGRPSVTPVQGYQFDAWWVDPEKERAILAGKAEVIQAAAEQDAPAAGEKTPWAWIVGGGAAVVLAGLALRRRRRKDPS